MTRAILPLLFCLALPAAAEEPAVPPPPALTPPALPSPDAIGEGMSLLEQGARSILRGLAAEIGPGLNEMQRSLQEMRPQLDAMGEALAGLRPLAEQILMLMDNIGNYEPPVLQPNGDILIRRKPGLPPPPPAEGEIDL